MKAYTDLEQSKKLAEILPVESADMTRFNEENIDISSRDNVIMENYISAKKKFSMCGEIPINPCWSLAALLEVIRVECRMEKTPLDQSGEFTYSLVDDYDNIRTYEEGNPIDACVEMIYKLKEKDLL